VSSYDADHIEVYDDELVYVWFNENREKLDIQGKTLILEINSFEGAWFSEGHAYAKLRAENGNGFDQITLGWRITKAAMKSQPQSWNRYKPGDWSSRFLSAEQAKHAALKWFEDTFHNGSGWRLIEYVWQEVEDANETYMDRVEKELATR
jgi:hypothetical protein